MAKRNGSSSTMPTLERMPGNSRIFFRGWMPWLRARRHSHADSVATAAAATVSMGSSGAGSSDSASAGSGSSCVEEGEASSAGAGSSEAAEDAAAAPPQAVIRPSSRVSASRMVSVLFKIILSFLFQRAAGPSYTIPGTDSTIILYIVPSSWK